MIIILAKLVFFFVSFLLSRIKVVESKFDRLQVERNYQRFRGYSEENKVELKQCDERKNRGRQFFL